MKRQRFYGPHCTQSVLRQQRSPFKGTDRDRNRISKHRFAAKIVTDHVTTAPCHVSAETQNKPELRCDDITGTNFEVNYTTREFVSLI